MHKTDKLCKLLKLFTTNHQCDTLSYMKSSTITIRIDEELSSLLDMVTKKTGRNRSDIAREALKRQLRVTRFDNLRKRVMPFAEARGYLTDDDVFSAIS